MEIHKNKKKYSQNFLNDNNLLKKIVEKADIKNKNVVEIGPGKGSLTKFIFLSAKKVLAYEIDLTLKPFLNFKNQKNIEIIYDDFLKRNLKKDFFQHFKSEKISLIGNLPYHITTPLIFKFLEETQINSFTIMIQKEVGLRLLAKPKTKNYNAITVIVQSMTKVTKIVEVKNTMFYPIPKVNSIVLKFDKKNLNENVTKFQKNFFIFIKNSFKQKRKTLINNLTKEYKIPKIKTIFFFQENKINYNIRAEEISIEKLEKISKLWFIFLKNL